MSVIKRTAFFESDKDGNTRFYEWAYVYDDAIGRGCEPYFVNLVIPFGSNDQPDGRRNLDYNDEMTKASLEPCNFDRIAIGVFGDGVMQLHGGNMYPRVGR